MGSSMSKEEKQKIVNEKFFATENNIFNLKEADFANKESMPFYDVIIYLQTTMKNELNAKCPDIYDRLIFCKENNSEQLSEDWKKKWLLKTEEQKIQTKTECGFFTTQQPKEMCDKNKDLKIEYSMGIFQALLDIEDLKNINKILIDADIHNFIDNSGKINDKNKIIQNALEYAANHSNKFKNSAVFQMLSKLFGKEVSVNTIIYFAQNFFKVANEISEAKKLQKDAKIGSNEDLQEVLLELKNRYINHILQLKSKISPIVNNLYEVTVSNFESESYAPFYNQVKNMGSNYSFGLFSRFLQPLEVNQLINTLKNDMNENPEDYFNVDGKLLDKKRKLMNHISEVLNRSKHAKKQFKDYFQLINEPTLELALLIVNACNANMSNDERATVAKQIEIQENMKKATLYVQTAGNSDYKKKRLQSIRNIIRKHAIRKIVSKTKK